MLIAVIGLWTIGKLYQNTEKFGRIPTENNGKIQETQEKILKNIEAIWSTWKNSKKQRGILENIEELWKTLGNSGEHGKKASSSDKLEENFQKLQIF